MGTPEQVNADAMQLMTSLDQHLRALGWPERRREQLLVRLLLCFFSEQTDVFGRVSFFAFLEDAPEWTPVYRLKLFFAALGGELPASEDPKAPESETLDALRSLPVISRALFGHSLEMPDPGEEFIHEILACRKFPWKELSPDIFGAMFQEIMDQDDRREQGAYYTSEENIDRLIDPLFMDDLRAEREACRGHRHRLEDFHSRLAALSFLDPACGCGNFLIRIYTQLRRLEFDVLKELHPDHQRVLDISMYCRVSTSHFFGIEIEPFQAQIARACLWLAERQLDLTASELFGTGRVKPAVISAAGIHQGNALTMDWAELIPADRLTCIAGNPPFAGARLMNRSQKQDMREVFGNTAGCGNMDYVTAWYRKAAEYMSGTAVRAAFVSTSSVAQGEQAARLWNVIGDRFGMKIDFARRSFIWDNGTGDQAHVHCVIIGFSCEKQLPSLIKRYYGRRIYEGDRVKSVPQINAYLAAAPDVRVLPRLTPVSDVPRMWFGSMANDGGHLILSDTERENLLAQSPEAERLIRPFLGSQEFIHGTKRWCLWLTDADPEEYIRIPEVAKRIHLVQEHRERSLRDSTRRLAAEPARFGEIRQPEEGSMIVVPRVSSVRRRWIPIGFLPAEWIASDALCIVPGADEALFGILISGLHMVWVRTVAGRLKSDYRYSASVVYNNFPFPELSETKRQRVADAGKHVLEIRSHFPGQSLAELYDPDTMPAELADAHQNLDRTVLEAAGLGGSEEEDQLRVLLFRLQEILEAGKDAPGDGGELA